jgi:hypothetical protein
LSPLPVTDGERNSDSKVVQMWDVLKPTDIEKAQRQLNERRAETLRQQAEELAGLQADAADLEALDRLAAAFSSKFKKAAAPAVPAVPVSKKPDLPVIKHQPINLRPHSRQSEKRNLSGTNFEVFSRAVSKSGF